MPKSPNQKMKLLYMMKLFLEYSDENHVLTMQDIIEELARYDISAERKSIYDDIEALRLFGMDILFTKSRPSGYYLASRTFELPELKLLVDVVQSSKFITSKKSEELIKKLEGLASKHEATSLQRQVYVTNRVKTMNKTNYNNVDAIHTAISKNIKIRFQYFEWTVDKEVRLKKDGQFYEISPWALTWDDENYYMIGFDSEANMIKHYRVDKMKSVELTTKMREGKSVFARFDIAQYTNKTFGMFGGTEMDVELTCENRLVGVMIDRFGKDAPIRKRDEDTFTIRIKAVVSGQFFGWLSGLGSGVRISKPATVADEYKEYLGGILHSYE